MRRHVESRSRQGFTLIELVLAAALMAVLMMAVFGLMEGSLSLWRKSETRRNLSEQASGVSELLAADLRALEGGARGDLLAEWERFDTDGDGLKESAWPRLRFVRQASAAEMARIEAAHSADAGATRAPGQGPGQGPGLVEVAWFVLPYDKKDPDARSEGLVYRGVRRLDEREADSFFAKGFLAVGGTPDLSRLDEVTGGVLWLRPLFATQTSIVHDGWVAGPELADAATSWDAWAEERPDPTRHEWNVPGEGMPKVEEHALLPRRVRLELEVERPVDRKRRTRSLERIELSDVAFEVDDERLLPEPGAFLKLDGEWMELKSRSGRQVIVSRGVRGTQPMIHDPGTLVHWGLPLVREVEVEMYREDWNL